MKNKKSLIPLAIVLSLLSIAAAGTITRTSKFSGVSLNSKTNILSMGAGTLTLDGITIGSTNLDVTTSFQPASANLTNWSSVATSITNNFQPASAALTNLATRAAYVTANYLVIVAGNTTNRLYFSDGLLTNVDVSVNP